MTKTTANELAEQHAIIGNVAAARSSEVLEQHAMIGNVIEESPYERTLHPDVQWFGNAGLGLFLHWGLSSVLGQYDLSWGMMKRPAGSAARNIKVHGLRPTSA